MPHVDVLYNSFQSRLSNKLSIDKIIDNFEKSIQNVRNGVKIPTQHDLIKSDAPGRNQLQSFELISAAKEACDLISFQLIERFQSTAHTKSFQLLDPTKFEHYRKSFPDELATEFCSNYSFMNKDKLKNELKVIYNNETFSSINSVSNLYKFIMENNLEKTFNEAKKLAEIILVTPISSAEAERNFSTLKRIKTNLRNSMGQDRLNALTALSVHQKEIENVKDFNDKVIELFATGKQRRTELLYK